MRVQRRCTGDDDEEADHSRHDGPGENVHTLESEVLGPEPLVHRVGLDEREPPWRKRRADGRGRHQQRVTP